MDSDWDNNFWIDFLTSEDLDVINKMNKHLIPTRIHIIPCSPKFFLLYAIPVLITKIKNSNQSQMSQFFT